MQTERQVEQIINLFLKELEIPPNMPPDVADWLHLIHTNLCNPELSVSWLKEQSNMGQDNNRSSRFKWYMGFGPKQYITKLRAELAKKLLKLEELNQSDVTWWVGYEDASTFSRVLKQYK